MKKINFLISGLCLCSLLQAQNKDYRSQTYKAYEPTDIVAKRLKTSGYSRFENPTGIFFEKDEQITLRVKNSSNQKVQLRITNFGPEFSDSYYNLKEGVNEISVTKPGLGYISYYTPDYKQAPEIQIDITGGKINGYFDASTDSNKDWQELLQNAQCPTIDLIGKNVHLAYSTEELRKYCPADGLRLISQYDSIIAIQHDLMGLTKYNETPANRMFGRAMWNGFMHADGMGAAFHRNTLQGLADVNKVLKDSWGIAHEFGHVNQTRPEFKWVSTTEVTNNIFSAWTQYLYAPENLRLEHERIDGGEGSGPVVGGRFNAYLNHGVLNGENWLCQKGPDRMKDYENGGDHFVKLCPLWQLQLYYAAAQKGNKDIYADITHLIRNAEKKQMSNGEMQLQFMKLACDVQKENLTPFFEKAGMLKPIDRNLDDYTRGQMTITQEQCDELKQYASRYKKPESPVIYYISGNSVDAYKNKLTIKGSKGKGISENEKGQMIISHEDWKNVVVFETYKGKELVKITMIGTGFKDNTATLVVMPEGSDRIEAVGWNGKRKTVLEI